VKCTWEKIQLSFARNYDWLTFDCYGTLIDWEAGIHSAFKHALSDTGISAFEESRVFQLYEEEERRIEKESPFRTYREVLSLAASRAARKLGIELPEGRSRVLVEQLPSWSPFPDTNPALEKLSSNHKLGILSNVDDDLLAGTLKHFTVPFNMVITAEKLRSYKPGTKHFEEARRVMGANASWLHVAGSIYHDIDPASRLGIESVWVNRKSLVSKQGFLGKRVKEVRNLTELTRWLKR
jgi:2-haloalkanoic acid dehalogenase type II